MYIFHVYESISILEPVFLLLPILSVCKSAGHWLPKGRPLRQGRSLYIRPHPARVQGVSRILPLASSCRPFKFLQVLKVQGGPPLPPAPPKSKSKSDQKSNQKKVQIFDPKWPPKGTLKIQKISPNLQNGTLKPLSRALLAAPISERVSKSSPRTSRTSKIIVLLK